MPKASNKYNPQNSTAPCDEVEVVGRTGDIPKIITEDQKAATRRVIAGYPGINAEDAEEIFLMLGIYPGQETDEFKTPPRFLVNSNLPAG
jgi:hypothetical protein